MPYTRPIIALGIAETLVWAGTFYLFPALLPVWEADLGWSKAQLTGGYTLALLVSALASPQMGALIDRNLGRWVLSGSACLAGVFLGVLALAEQLWWFYMAWIGLGVAMAGALYDPCFAFLVRQLGLRARQAITLITLIAGFAGTVSFPAANVLAATFDWRVAVLVFAVVVVVVAAPTFWFAASRMDGGVPTPATERGLPRAMDYSIFRNPVFWCIGMSLGLLALNHGMVITHLLPLLEERGIVAAAAVVTASMIGPMQVVGRLGLMAFGGNVSSTVIMVLCILATAVAGVALFAAGATPILLVLFVALYGAGWGVASIAKPLLIRDHLGERNYGTVAGYLAVPFLLAIALGPILGSMVWELGTYDAVILTGIVMTAVATVLIALAGHHRLE